MQDKGQNREVGQPRHQGELGDFVLDKGIFSNIFEKDIRRVYIYKKAERLAKAIHLVSPAFAGAPALRDRLGQIAVGLVDAAIEPPGIAREKLSRELLALSSVLSIAQSGGILSSMNANVISREAHILLQEIATYEEPRVLLEESPTLATLAKDMQAKTPRAPERELPKSRPETTSPKGQNIGQVSDRASNRRDAILSVLRGKGRAYIKDISTVIRDVSEKTIQRELQALVEAGKVTKTGERRWTVYEAKP